MKYNPTLQRAVGLVINAFGDKTRLGPHNPPMWTHSVRVGLSLISYGYGQSTVISGILHDAIEDTYMTADMIGNLFGTTIRHTVETCSFSRVLGDTPAGIADIHRRVLIEASNGNLEPLIVKIGDSKDNLDTNEVLKPEWQIDQFHRAVDWVAAGRKYLPDHRIVDDLEIVVERERKRLGL